MRFVLPPNGKLSRPHRHNAPRDAHSADRWGPQSPHRPPRPGTRATQSHCRLGPTEAPPYGSMAWAPSQGDRWAAGRRRTGGQHETRNKTLWSVSRAPKASRTHATGTAPSPTDLGGAASPRPQGPRAMAAMMMTAGESKSPARALRRLAGAAVAAVLLRRTFSASKWYAVFPSRPCRCLLFSLPRRPLRGDGRRTGGSGLGGTTDGWGPCLCQQDGGADGDGADEAAAEPAGGAGAADAPRHRRAPPRQTGGHRAHQGERPAPGVSVCLVALQISSSEKLGLLILFRQSTTFLPARAENPLNGNLRLRVSFVS